MEINIINEFMNFKIDCLKNYSKLIGKEILEDDDCDYYLDKYLNTYINIFYYHKLGTLDYKDNIKYNSSVIHKELEGMYYEIIYDIENSNLIEPINIYNLHKRDAKECFKLVYFITFIDRYIKVEEDYQKYISDMDKILLKNKEIKEIINEEILSSLYELLLKDNKKIERYFNSLSDIDFISKYKKYVDTNNYLVLLENNIKRLKNSYSNAMVDRVYKFDKVSIDRIKMMIYLVSIDILKKLLNNEVIDHYFIWFSEVCFSNKKIFEKYLKQIDNPLLKEKIVILINSNDYSSHINLFNNYRDYTYGVICDMSHINDVEKKIQSLESIDLFKYIVLDKVKNKDYDFIKKYQFEKEMFFNKFKKV